MVGFLCASTPAVNLPFSFSLHLAASRTSTSRGASFPISLGI
jgi:hypothetical protein